MAPFLLWKSEKSIMGGSSAVILRSVRQQAQQASGRAQIPLKPSAPALLSCLKSNLRSEIVKSRP